MLDSFKCPLHPFAIILMCCVLMCCCFLTINQRYVAHRNYYSTNYNKCKYIKIGDLQQVTGYKLNRKEFEIGAYFL